jgi:hypothetical protein
MVGVADAQVEKSGGKSILAALDSVPDPCSCMYPPPASALHFYHAFFVPHLTPSGPLGI